MLRASATLGANGTCGTFGSFSAISGWTSGVAHADTTVANGNCYEYKWQVFDNVGNTSTSAASGIAKVDTQAPVFSAGSASAETVTLSFTDNENLSSTAPAASSFAVYVNGVAVTPTSVTISGDQVSLNLANPVHVGQLVTLNYTAPGTNPLKDLAGNLVANLSGVFISNTTPLKSSKLVFTAAPVSGGATSVYSVEPDGSNLTKLTNPSGALDNTPAWSPDETRIAFTRTSSAGGLLVMNADGSNQHVIVPQSSVNGAVYPSWSPDGTKIAFEGRTPPGGGFEQIFVVNADGTDLTLLTTNTSYDYRTPAWSPDGSKIAFLLNTDGGVSQFDVITMNPDGSDQTALTTCACFGGPPSWSPNGAFLLTSRLAYPGASYGNIWVVNADGSGQTQLTHVSSGSGAGGGQWSPDGNQIVFMDGTTNDIAVMNDDGTNVHDLALSTIWMENAPTWSGPSLNIGWIPPNWAVGGGNPAVPGLCPCKGSAAEPVDTATGSFYENSTDAAAATFGLPLAFRRTYDTTLAQNETNSGTPGPLGYGWTDNYDMSLDITSSEIKVTQADGAEVDFYPPVTGACQAPYIGPGSPGTYCALPDVEASLTYNSTTSTYTFTTHPYRSYTFNSAGDLTAEAEAGLANTTITAGSPAPGTGDCPSSAATCTTVTAPSGRSLVIAKNSSGQITQVADNLNHVWLYSYCPTPGSTCSTGDLVSVTDPLSRVTSFTYDATNSNPNLVHDLISLTKPNGQSGGPDAGAHLANTYNSAGQVTQQTDPDGNVTSFDYTHVDSAVGDGYTVVTDPDGNETRYSYLGGVLVSKTSGYGSSQPSIWVYSPDPETLANTATTDPDGHTTTYTYDVDGNVLTTTDALGHVTSTSYNSFDEPTCTTEPLAASACASLSPPTAIAAGTSTVTPPSAAPPKYATYTEYDTDGNQIWTTAGDYQPGSSTASQSRTTYDLYSGQSVTLTSGAVSCGATPPATSLPCLTIDPNGVVTQLGYDATSGDLTSTATPDGNSGGELATKTYTYNGNGQLHTVVAPDGNLTGAIAANFTTTNTYDADGELTDQTVSHTGGTIVARDTSYGYDADGNLTTQVAPLGNVSGNTPANYTTTTSFDANDQPTLVTDPDGQKTLTCYDGDGDIAETVPPVGVAANALAPTSCPTAYPAGYGDRLAADATTYTYNPIGRQTVVTTPAPAGLTGSETTTNSYTAAGRLSSVTAPATSNVGGAPNNVTTYTYDPAGELTSKTMGAGTSAVATTVYCYDPDGNQTAEVPPNGNAVTVQTCATSSPYQTPSAYQTIYSYDSLGEQVGRTRPATTWATGGQTTTYAFDTAGNETGVTDPNGVTSTRTFTPLNQTATVTYSGSAAHSVNYGYDADGNRTLMTDASGTSNYGYTVFGELANYQNGAGKTVSYGYDADGNITGITYPLASGASWATTHTVGYSYDYADELTSVSDFNNNSILIGNTADGLPNSISLPAGTDNLSTTYDQTDQPSRISLDNSGGTLLRFDYTAVPSGAIATETDTPGTSTSPADYTYDPPGRVTQMVPGTSATLNYSFDTSNNVTTTPTGATASYDKADELTSSTLAGTTTNYQYDSDGQRTQSTVAGSTTTSASYNGAEELTSYSNNAANMTSAVYDGDGLRATTTITPSGGSAVTQNYIWNGDPNSPTLLQDSTNAYIDGPNGLIEQVNLSSGSRSYLVADRLGSVRGVVSGTGALTASTSYDAWGNPETTGGVAASTPFGFASGYTDSTGLLYLIHRYYDGSTGQFVTVDPLVDRTSSAYSYALGDPVDLADPYGLSGCSLLDAWNPQCDWKFVDHHWRGIGQGLAVGTGTLAVGACIAATEGVCAGIVGTFAGSGAAGGLAGGAYYGFSGGPQSVVGYADAAGEGATLGTLSAGCALSAGTLCATLGGGIAFNTLTGGGVGLYNYLEATCSPSFEGGVNAFGWGVVQNEPIPIPQPWVP